MSAFDAFDAVGPLAFDPTLVQQLVNEVIARENAILEEWCWRSLLDYQRRGVLVVTETRMDLDGYSILSDTTYSLSDEVPWCTIHRYPYGKDDR